MEGSTVLAQGGGRKAWAGCLSSGDVIPRGEEPNLQAADWSEATVKTSVHKWYKQLASLSFQFQPTFQRSGQVKAKKRKAEARSDPPLQLVGEWTAHSYPNW